ncbi:HEPN domain-containing protein [Halegenticoccus tardaugens]|uniref:HEPN domain-containing protein n=1 Tax=Halegenticoccus tardaugens TaxID=2071624 RepID=UPI0013E9296B|nr:HEPN domain-containing protein [Halegenticoccus tardaugens]
MGFRLIHVNRLYYACFHAAQAVLYAKGFEPTSHRGVSTLFGKEIVLKGDAPRDDGRFLSELWDLREQADYGYEPLDLDLSTLRSRTDAFVSRMETLANQLREED